MEENFLDRAFIRIDYDAPEKARAIALALSPDNATCPRGLSINTRNEGPSLEITLESILRLETFLATLDDLMRCLQVAERVLETLG
ncbi:KEOPS complex subunit [Candidatus Bathyarchaeota archaeon]|nr:KEOPS complex subunit [Candidatus Bathyarchaeota archaeon]